MALINRIEDLIKSEVHALLDKAEDPQKLTAQLLVDLNEALSDCRATAAAIMSEQKALTRRQTHHSKQIQMWQQKAEHALSKDRDDLAKAALLEKQKLTTAQQGLEQQQAALEETLSKLKADADHLAGKIQTLKSKQQMLYRADRTASSRLKVRSTLHSHNVDNVQARFAELESKVEQVEAKVDSYELGKSSTAEQFEVFERDEKVAAELAALKQKVQNQGAQAGA